MKLIMCRGLPASGKTTWALQQKDCVVVSSDDIRARMGGFKPALEDLVQIEKDSLIRRALYKGQSVISDDPNMTRLHENKLRALARRYGADFEIKTFDTPFEECVRRDSLRAKRVGRDAIQKYVKISESESR